LPSRLYTGIDLINYATIQNFSTVNASASYTSPSQGNLTVSGAGADSDAGPTAAATTSAGGELSLSGDFDYNAAPAIPDNARITKVRLSFAASLSGTAQGILAAGVGNSQAIVVFTARCLVVDSLAVETIQATALSVFDEESNPVPSTSNASDSETVTYSNSVEITHDPPIDKATLLSTYTTLLFGLFLSDFQSVNGGASNDAAGTTQTANISGYSVALNNFQFLVTYLSGPELVLSPPSGNVGPGQSITVTGPGAPDYTYAATNGPQVIPIIPKIVGPDEVILEVPTPLLECGDCFDDCPECDDCLAACNEDLAGEACQNCLQACLDCLVECLDDLEEGEKCLESADDPPDTEIPITIICGTPGNEFTGTVPLGDFTILIAEASGIYKLVDGKSNDTLYTSARDGTTYDVKIPNPKGKTGFFRD
jgi:hypothetical protein